MTGTPPAVRKRHGEPAPTTPWLGTDVAGTVVAVGTAVAHFAPGDDVFGGRGGASPSTRAPPHARSRASRRVSRSRPPAAPVAGVTALQGLREHGHLEAGQRLLVNGASGGVGTFAVQLAKAFGAHVTGVCSARNVELVRSLGADEVIDYTQRDFTAASPPYDLLLDTVGNHSVAEYERCLAPGRVGVLVGSTEELRAQMVGYEPKAGAPRLVTMLARLTSEDLTTLAALLEAGTIVPVIEQRYRLNQTADAMAHLGTKRARGKVIITVVEPSR